MPRYAERRLVSAAAAGDERAREELVEAFMPSIAGVARTYRRAPAIESAELLQEGVVGLLRALERYDPALGTPFWAYASWWVRQAMQQLVAQMTLPVVMSDRALRQLARVRDARRAGLQAERHEPSSRQLASATGFSTEQVDRLCCAERAARSLEERHEGESAPGGNVGDMLADPVAEERYDHLLDQVALGSLTELWSELTDRERTVLRSHFGIEREPQTLREIGSGLGLSSERVRQIEERALGKMRDAAQAVPARPAARRRGLITAPARRRRR
jgi:RNA polymerase sigma factor (sigma-70 family)